MSVPVTALMEKTSVREEKRVNVRAGVSVEKLTLSYM
jgi:hypothetical protein